jgi:hypothetical protein
VEVPVRLPRLLSGGAVVAVLVGTAACGLQTVEPKLELRDAADAFSSSRSTSLRLSLPSSLADVKAFTTEADAESPADESTSTDSATETFATATSSSQPSDADLQQLLSSHVDVAFDKGADAKGSADDSARVLLHIGKTDAGEVRTVGGMVYARVDLTGLEGEFPDMKDGVESTRAALAGGEGPDSPPEALRAPVQAVFDGKWVSVDDRPGSWLDQQLTSQDGAAGGLTGTLAPDAPDKLTALAGKAFGDGVVTVKRLDGDDALGDHLVATANLRTVYRNIRADLPGLLTGDAATEMTKALPAAEEVPDRDLAVSFWVKDGKLSRFELDIAQFLDKPAGHLVLRADTLADQPVAAPSGAVAVDLKGIADANGGSLAGLLGGAGADQPVDAQTAAAWVDQDIRAQAEADGAKPSASYLAQVQGNYTDMQPPVTLKKVGKRIQVTVDGTSVCLTPAATTDQDGTVTDGRC